MGEGFSSVYATVDHVGQTLKSRSVRRGFPRRRLRLPDSAADEILDGLRVYGEAGSDTPPSPLAREVVWHLILQGYDGRFLAGASRRKRSEYRALTAAFAPEVRRPEDARPYAWVMPWRPPEESRPHRTEDWIGRTLQWGFDTLGDVRDVGDGRGQARIGGHDEVVWEGTHGYVMQMDGGIWRVDATNGEARRTPGEGSRSTLALMSDVPPRPLPWTTAMSSSTRTSYSAVAAPQRRPLQ